MSNEENRQQPEGYQNYNPASGQMPGAGGAQGMPGMQGMHGMQEMQGMQGFPQGFTPSPYFPQAPSGSMMGAQPPQMQQMPQQQMPQAQQFPFPGPGQGQTPDVPGMLPVEESYIENILRLNKGKVATVYMTFENNERWNAKVFKGIVEAAGRDHIILSDPESGRRYLLLMVYLDYITFDEELNYEYPFAAGASQLASYPPR